MQMAVFGSNRPWLIIFAFFIGLVLVTIANGENIFLEWHVAIDSSIRPAFADQPVITINGMFPGPLINATTNDLVQVNVFNDMDEPLLFTCKRLILTSGMSRFESLKEHVLAGRNGIQQRLNSWQDGVSGTNCAIQPGTNWTYVFQTKDQIGSFFYFPSLNFQKAGGGYGPFRVNNRIVIPVPFPKPEAEFDLLIGDWYNKSYKEIKSMMNNELWAYQNLPNVMLMNGRGSYLDPNATQHESFTVTNADQDPADYYIVASPKMSNATGNNSLIGVAVLHYDTSTTPATGLLPGKPDPFDINFSRDQAKSIRWNLTTGAARPNPQGTFNVSNVTLSQSFLLRGSSSFIDGAPLYTVNNVSYLTPDTPLKLADQFANGSGVYELDKFPVNSSILDPVRGVFVASGIHKGWIEIVFQNKLQVIDSWHLDGFGFYVVGFGDGEWRPEFHSSYNTYNPVVRSTTQVYPGGWTAVYAFLDNPGMWNLRSQLLKNWYLGQELYLRVYDPDPNPAKERLPPENLIYCGKFQPPAGPPGPSAGPPPKASPPGNSAPPQQKLWFLHILAVYIVTVLLIG
ncbi:hypothetical protein Patl1_06007 [Pistacia atlantica]|uniref:Uncharacterized protein n=1 Tax=Pistacia atlantica TaxID=434234 RepID=A0ACC1BST1_9ROSI|nr:hypothetical protein Patl1_06007 [Pistacia atlantica]